MSISGQHTPSPRRIAIIGVHGVGEHDPGVTARGIARQLQHTQQGQYSAFAEIQYSVPVSGQILQSMSAAQMAPAPRSRIAKGFGAKLLKVMATPQPKHPVDVEFSSSLLIDGAGYRSVYASTVLKGQRNPAGAVVDSVDIHELYWSDLSHSGSGAFAMFDQVVQLLIHVASFGRTVAASILGTLGNKPPTAWKGFYFLNALSYWLLSIPIVIGNLIFALLAVLLLPLLAPGSVAYAIPALAAIIAMGGSGSILFGRPGSVLTSIAIGAAAAALTYWLVFVLCTWISQPVAMTVLELPLLLVIGEVLMRSYDQSHPGVLIVWRTTAVVLGLWMAAIPAIQYAWHRPSLSLIEWLGHVVEGLFGLLVVIWGLLYIANLSLLVLGTVLRFTQRARHAPEVVRSIDTTFIAASVPAPLLLALILSLWSAAYHAFGRPLADPQFAPWCKFLFGDTAEDTSARTAWGFIGGLINQSANPFFLIYVIVMLAAALLLVWGVLPSVMAEISPPAGGMPGITRSKALGSWLDNGFTAFGCAAALAGFGFFLVLPVGAAFQYSPPDETSWMGVMWSYFRKHEFIAYTGVIFGASAVTFLGATKLFATNANFLAKLRVPIDTALDVDNWMRERPVGNTPRLRIFARLAALMKHIEAGKYDQIVFVAHSQGTVIVCDFLRYMLNTQPEFLEALPARRLLTMGSPLRQLYALRFPILYGWVNRPPPGVDGGPEPAGCGLTCWVNAYGSGDYVGRYLWYADNNVARWTNARFHPPVTKEEFCVGPWAHTHYFDEGNTAIGTCLDSLM